MKGITYTQVAQYCVLIFAYMVPAVFISILLTGNAIPQLGFGSELVDGGGHLLAKLDGLSTELGFAPYTSGQKPLIDVFCITAALMIGTAGLPHVIVRFFTVPKIADARKSAGWALIFIALLYTVAPAVAAMAIYNFANTIQTGPVGDPEGNLPFDQQPSWMERWGTTGLLVFEDKNGDGRIQYYNDKNPEMQARAEEFGWAGNEVTKIDNDIMVLANPEIAGLPNWVTALVAAGGIAAALSTAAGLLMAISAAVSHDLIKGVFMPNISEKNELLAGKVSMAVAIVIAGWLGLNPPGFAAGTVALAFGIAASSLFPAIMMGIFSKKMNKEGAIAGMLAGLAVTLFYVFAHKGIFFVKGTEFLDLIGGANSFFGITPEAFGAIGALVNFAVAFAVDKVTKEPPEHIQHMVEAVRIPRGSKAVDGAH
jgi:cation/acetate symporter